jgi:hypothetical protein
MPQEWNRYAYALGNPIKIVDPDGRENKIYFVATAGTTSANMNSLNAKVRGTKYEGRVELVGPKATKGNIYMTLRSADSSDIVILAGHSGQSEPAGGGNFLTRFNNKKVITTGSEMADWMTRDGSAPKAVIFASCCSNQLADTMAAAGSIGIGTTKTTLNVENQPGAIEAAAVIANGGTPQEAAAAATRHLKWRGECSGNPNCDINAKPVFTASPPNR